MKKLEVLLGCEGKAPDAYPDDIKRCEWCCDNTAGSYQISVEDNIYQAVIFESMTTDQLVKSRILPANPPNCPRGATRYWTSSVIG